ncbi:hypothetical protein JCM10908_003907 [Rhodotorula pacifica]|uniref:uncharacterized protein n=1 Tax=Rhodotorula pacifica TaxID=1495444 RepID=UPI00316C12EC
MGALCGKEDHFDALERHGKGNKLSGPGTSANAAAPTSTSGATSNNTKSKTQAATKSVSTSPPQRLGGGAADGGTVPVSAEDTAARREAMLAAAEARNKASATRGTKNGGKLTQQLERQAKDGGRADEARREAERKGNEPLVGKDLPFY